MKRSLFTLFCALLLVSFIVACPARAEGEVKASTTVTATVPSKACPQFSTLGTNVAEVLADNSQKILVTVNLKDCNNEVLGNSDVQLITNRGAVEHVDVVDVDGNILKGGNGTGIVGTTNAEGILYFQVYSQIPGEATITLRADSLVTLGSLTIRFSTVPFPRNVSVSVQIPPIIGRLLPSYNDKSKTLPLFVPEQQEFDENSLVNLGVELVTPFWLFVIILALLLSIPILALSNILLLRKIRKEQKIDAEKIEAEVAEIHEEIEKVTEETSGLPKS